MFYLPFVWYSLVVISCVHLSLAGSQIMFKLVPVCVILILMAHNLIQYGSRGSQIYGFTYISMFLTECNISFYFIYVLIIVLFVDVILIISLHLFISFHLLLSSNFYCIYSTFYLHIYDLVVGFLSSLF